MTQITRKQALWEQEQKASQLTALEEIEARLEMGARHGSKDYPRFQREIGVGIWLDAIHDLIEYANSDDEHIRYGWQPEAEADGMEYVDWVRYKNNNYPA